MLRIVRPRVTDSMSAKASNIMFAGFKPATFLTDPQIAKAIKNETGEKIAPRTIGRRRSEYKAIQAAYHASREEQRIALDLLNDENIQVSAVAKERWLDAIATGKIDVLKLDPLQAEKLALDREKLELDKSKHELEKRKQTRVEERDRKAEQATEDLAKKAESGEQVTAEDIERLRSLYGVRKAAA